MWLLYSSIVLLTVVLAVQESKRALLPASKTTALWFSVLVSFACAVVLRSGWRRDSDWSREQRELGTLSNSFYAPRRDEITQGFTVAGGVLGGLWWGLSTWGVLLSGIRQSHGNRGLLGFETAAVVGVITGGMVGAVVGVYVGDRWERRHRRRRREKAAPA
jgi:hypothetical protein